VWGVGKVYDTYVGKKHFEPDDKVFEKIRDIGEEYGATTGRPRQCDWLDVDRLIKSININGITHLVLNKVDVLEKLNRFAVYDSQKIHNFDDCDDMCTYIMGRLDDDGDLLQDLKEIYFSGNKNNIN
jgi:adenylosuccinate synthase